MAPKSSVQTIVMVILNSVPFLEIPKSRSYVFSQTTQDAEGLKTLFWRCGRAKNLILEMRYGSKHGFGVAEVLKTLF